MGSTSGAGGTSLSSAAAVPPPRPRPNFPSVREIHKNAWLKRLPSQDKRGAHFSAKKAERFWVVFCVHNDEEAFLEFYTEPKMATIHKPQSFLSLNGCLHVSVSIIGQDNEYQFTVTLATEVVRLVAANWDQMIEWVESLQGKLREMNILSPKDNLYSKLPDVTTAPKALAVLASTHRDPTSPLPLPPIVGPSSAPQNHSQLRSVATQCGISACSAEPVNRRSAEITSEASAVELNNLSQLSINGNSTGLREMNLPFCVLPNTGASVLVDLTDISVPINCQPSMSRSNIGEESEGNRYVSTVNINVHPGFNGASSSSAYSRVFITSDDASTPDANLQPVENNISPHFLDSNESRRPSQPPETDLGVAFAEPSVSNLNTASNRMLPAACVTEVVRKEKKPPHRADHGHGSTSRVMILEGGTSGQHKNNVCLAKKSCSSENIYEHIYLPNNRSVRAASNQPTELNAQNGSHTNGNAYKSQVGDSRQETTNEPEDSHSQSVRMPQESCHPHTSRMHKVSGSSQRASSLGRIEFVQNADSDTFSAEGGAVAKNGFAHICTCQQNGANDQATIMNTSVGNSTFFGGNNEQFKELSEINWQTDAELEGNPISTLIGSRNGEYRIRRDASLVRIADSNEGRLGENDNHFTSRIVAQDRLTEELHANGSPVPLKEQQVVNLQNEINHPGGVRMVLKKRDCLNSIAFVDYLGAVWVAGWKQTQFPVLYYGFHVGDQLLKVAGSVVHSSLEASRAIKSASSNQVEFILRRIPYGRVFALKRSRDGEPLGLVAEGGSGEISEVLKDGLAARYGLPSKGLSVDGRVPCNWYLTEVNNRPLSLMSKENEVKDRLNAVGKEISILVQPADLVKHLRKSLKSYKNFKDYIVG